jgi:hypothetical protein
MDDKKEAALALADAEVRQAVDDARSLLVQVRTTLSALLREAAEGNSTNLTEVVKKQSELESALRRVFETEQKYDDWQRKSRGGQEPDAIDFDAIRVQIGCRLARLRDCCNQG